MILRIKQLVLMFGDIVTLYAALFAMIALRYGTFTEEYVSAHLMPFTIVFALWIIIFYIAGLYELRALRTAFDTARSLGISVVAGTLAAIIIFYTVPYFHISPKRSLVIFAVLYFAIGLAWRSLFATLNPAYRKHIVIVGSNRETDELYEFFKSNPHVGYGVIGYLNTQPLLTIKELQNTLSKYGTSLIVLAKKSDIPPHIREEAYRFAARGIELVDSSALYERIFRRMSLEFHDDLLSLAPQAQEKRVYDAIKTPVEFFLATLLLLILLIPLLLMLALVKLTSAGPGIYRQVRYGQFQKKFSIRKIRTMVQEAEKKGAQWAQEKDPRITWLGRILRYMHLDELPQLLNVLAGDISFVGPRPERPEFVKDLLVKIPHYELRHLVKPGITGWAQINYKYGSSVEDARVKLQYDLWYIKHRSPLLDLLIITRTIRYFFLNN
jgi:exopolysaccharide biosynthesis polyprenyl glycosylphosphotransferase